MNAVTMDEVLANFSQLPAMPVWCRMPCDSGVCVQKNQGYLPELRQLATCTGALLEA